MKARRTRALRRGKGARPGGGALPASACPTCTAPVASFLPGPNVFGTSHAALCPKCGSEFLVDTAPDRADILLIRQHLGHASAARRHQHYLTQP